MNIDSNEGWFMEMVAGQDFEEAPIIKPNLGNGIGNASINIKNPEVDNDDSSAPAITAIADWFNNTLAPTMNEYTTDIHGEEHIYHVNDFELVNVEGNRYTFRASHSVDNAGSFKVCYRMYPKNENIPHRQDFCYVKWFV